MRPFLFIFIFCLFTWSCGDTVSAEARSEKISGPKIYKTHCVICHGDDGRKGFADAKILPESALSLDERILLITNGRNTMMPYSGILSEEEIEAVAQYTLTLK